jgi:hypothetical protein
MNHRRILCLSAIATLGLALLPGTTTAQQKSIKDQIAGTWTFVSAIDFHPDGQKEDRWAPNPGGVIMFDGHGRYALFITRSDLPKIRAGAADKGTPEENKAIMSGFVASFGTYTVDESEKLVITHVEGSVYPNQIGADQKRLIVSLTADELKYTNSATSMGTRGETTWKRAK